MSRRIWLWSVSSAIVAAVALLAVDWAGAQKADKKPADKPSDAKKSENKDDDEKKSPDVVYVPTPHDVVAKMLEVAGVKKDDIVYDLGCGDGRIVVTAAKKYGCKGVGYEIDDERIKEAHENIAKNKVEKLVEIRKKDLFKSDLSEATVICTYLLPWMNTKLVPNFSKMKPGSRIVAHAYEIEGYKPDKTISFTSRADGASHTIYLWTIPLKKEKEGESE